MSKPRFKKLLGGASFLLIGSLLLIFSSKTKKNEMPDQIVRLNMLQEPATLNPTEARDIRSAAVISHLFDGLTRINQVGDSELSLAYDYTLSEDGKTYTFFLKDSVWSDNTPLSSRDFLYAWEKALNPNIKSNPDLLYVIKNAKKIKEGKAPIRELGISVPNDHTLIIELEKRTPYFLSLLTKPIFFPIPRHADQKNPKWHTETGSYISNGPFCIREWSHKEHLFLEANPLYWDRTTVSLNGIKLIMKDQSEDLAMYKKGELDWIGSPLSHLKIDTILEPQGERIQVTPALSTYFLRMQLSNKLLSNKSIRKALAIAIDREKISKNVILGKISPANSLVPPVMGMQNSPLYGEPLVGTAHTLIPPSMGVENTPYFSDNNPEKAQELFEIGLRELSLPSDEIPTMNLIVHNGERVHFIARYIAECWKEVLGITINIETLSDKEWFTRASAKDFDIAAGSWAADFDDPITFLQVFKYKDGNANNTSWENSEYIDTLDHAANILDQKERFKLYKKAETILMEEMPIIPIYYVTRLHIQNNHLHDVVFSSIGAVDFKWAYFTHGDSDE